MRTLMRNKSTFYYADFIKTDEMVDEEGYPTGQYATFYTTPKKYKANISPARGIADTEVFGINETYDKSIVLNKCAPDILETSLLWVDTLPVFDDEGNTQTPHDYIVKRVAKSINSTTLAIKKVVVGGKSENIIFTRNE